METDDNINEPALRGGISLVSLSNVILNDVQIRSIFSLVDNHTSVWLLMSWMFRDCQKSSVNFWVAFLWVRISKYLEIMIYQEITDIKTSMSMTSLTTGPA